MPSRQPRCGARRLCKTATMTRRVSLALLLVALTALTQGYAIDGAHEDAVNARQEAGAMAPRGGSFAIIDGREYFISDDADQVDFAQAKSLCQGMGKNLLSLETSQENSLIINYCVDHDCYLRYIWTSAEKVPDTRLWNWGTGVQIDFFDWAFSQPDNRPDETGIVVYPQLGWADTSPLTTYFNYICE